MKNIILGKKKKENIVREEKVKENPYNLQAWKEDESKRTRFAKHYNNGDGTFTMELSPSPIHYYDEKTKVYNDIDNSFEESEEGIFRLKSNGFKLGFRKEIKGTTLFELENHGHKIDVGFKNNKRSYQEENKQAKITNKDQYISQLVYENIEPFVDLEYLVEYNKIKENIIVNQRNETYEYLFELTIGELDARLSEAGTEIELVNNKDEVQFIIPSPVMFDSNGESSEEVSYEFEEVEEGKLHLTVKASAEWINNENRIFPVKIDPQIIVTFSEEPMVNHYQVGNLSPKNMVITTPASQIIVGKGGRIGTCLYAMAADFENLQKFEIVAAYISFDIFSIVDNNDAIVQQMTLNIGTLSYITNDDIESVTALINASTLIKSYSISKQFNSVTYDISQSFLSLGKRKITIIFYNNIDSLIATLSVPRLYIKYQYAMQLPNYYLNMAQGSIVESISSAEAGLGSASNIGTGILTTHIDYLSAKVFQLFQMHDEIYIRCSTSGETWGEWKGCGASETRQLIGGVLYWND